MPDFRFRLPSINDLTDTQKIAYHEGKPVLATGGPGSGKTVVSIFRFLREINATQKTVFFTYNRTLMLSIRGLLKQRSDLLLPDIDKKKLNILIQASVGSVFEWYGDKFHAKLSEESQESVKGNFIDYIRGGKEKFNELFIDEAQDLQGYIIEATYELAKKVTCGADRSQDIQGHYIGPADDIIYKLLDKKRNTIRQELTQNWRNTKEIFEFARKFVPDDDNVQALDIEELSNGETPEIIGRLGEAEQLDTIKTIIDQNANSNIGIIVHAGNEVDKIKDFLRIHYRKNGEDDFSYYYSGMNSFDQIKMEQSLKTPFIITFDSCKGLEFDIVILPFFESADWAMTKHKKDNGAFRLDANGKKMTYTIPNHYYVAATRARRQLFVLFNKKPRILNFWQENMQPDLFKVGLPF